MQYEDILINILHQADIDSIKTLCNTNLQAKRLCTNDNFWRDIFARDGLPFMTIRLSHLSYFYEYKHVEYCWESAQKIGNKLPKTAAFLIFYQDIANIDILFVPGVDRAQVERLYLSRRYQKFPSNIANVTVTSTGIELNQISDDGAVTYKLTPEDRDTLTFRILYYNIPIYNTFGVNIGYDSFDHREKDNWIYKNRNQDQDQTYRDLWHE